MGETQLQNVVAIAPGRSPQAIVLMAHRDDTGLGPGANDNASGTGAMLELARVYASLGAGGGGRASPGTGPAHNIIFVSTDGGDYGALGAYRFATHSPYRNRVLAVVDIDALAGKDTPAIQFAADTPRSPPATLVQTAAARIKEQGPSAPRHPGALAQMIDLGFPFNLYEQAPMVGRGNRRRDADDRGKPARRFARRTRPTGCTSAGWARWAARRRCCSVRSTRGSS